MSVHLLGGLKGRILSSQEFKRALGYSTAAIDLLKRGSVPPYPQFYELLYTYATGVNPTLNARINSIFRETDPVGDLAERLYNAFLKSNDANERINTVSERMSTHVEAVHEAIAEAMKTAKAYEGSLERTGASIDDALTPERLRAITARMLSETRHMQEANRQLEEKLEASRDDIHALQRDLDEVRRESLLDPLTKIYNRKHFDEGLLAAFGESSEHGTPLSLVLLDIDHFKNFNDTWGHQTGDQVLRLVAMTMKSNVKGQDIAARYGGEEFAAILPHTDLEGAIILADNIRKAIQSKELLKRSTNEKLGRITASFGVASYQPGDTPASLIERTDQCLYAAKHAGRNRVFSETELKKLQSAAAA